MQPIPFKITQNANASFHIQVNHFAYQYDKLHYHPEYQISLILKGSGQVAVGEMVSRFEPGDIYFLGPNVPHVFKNDASYFENPQQESTHMISIFFRDYSFGNNFFNLPEFQQIRQFLDQTVRGIKLDKELAVTLQPILFNIQQVSGAAKLINLLSLINQISLSTQWSFISQQYLPGSWMTSVDSSLDKVFSYIAQHFDQTISLEEVAKLTHLNKYAFCKYFKRVTHKSFVTYLNEFRVSIACKYLVKNTYSVSQIGFMSGFNNLSNFYRQFKKIMNCTPSKYRELYANYF